MIENMLKLVKISKEHWISYNLKQILQMLKWMNNFIMNLKSLALITELLTIFRLYIILPFLKLCLEIF